MATTYYCIIPDPPALTLEHGDHFVLIPDVASAEFAEVAVQNCTGSFPLRRWLDKTREFVGVGVDFCQKNVPILIAWDAELIQWVVAAQALTINDREWLPVMANVSVDRGNARLMFTGNADKYMTMYCDLIGARQSSTVVLHNAREAELIARFASIGSGVVVLYKGVPILDDIVVPSGATLELCAIEENVYSMVDMSESDGGPGVGGQHLLYTELSLYGMKDTAYACNTVNNSIGLVLPENPNKDDALTAMDVAGHCGDDAARIWISRHPTNPNYTIDNINEPFIIDLDWGVTVFVYDGNENWAINPDAIGAEGEEGPQGPQGVTGDSGDGIPGPQGPQGEASVVPGPQGQTGQKGSQGEQGVAGNDSTVPGPQGDDGLTGPQGNQGATGADSTVAGPQGDDGITGSQGAQGDAGADSVVAGPQGATGPQGPRGFRGDVGITGPQGDTGLTGTQGFQGDTGAQGLTGPQGADGVSDIPGPQGFQGDTGPQGPQGFQGVEGTGSQAHDLNFHVDVNTPTPNDGQVLTFDVGTGMWIPKTPRTVVGVNEFDYRLTLPITAVPASGRLSRDNADPTLATIIYMHKIDLSGDDMTLFLQAMQAGDWLNIHDDANVNDSEAYDVTGTPVLTGDIFAIPVVSFSVEGVPLTNNQVLRVFWRVTEEGLEGPQGPQGFQGETGAQGDTGDQGPQGFQGDIGATGTQGFQGDTGADSTVAGPQGDAGADGTNGAQGAVGPQGPEGFQGDAGAVGPQGTPGADSTVAGPQGDSGAQGAAGADSTVAGPQGDAGAAGTQGDTGAQGAAGADSTVAGPQGDTGATGGTGPQGDAGAVGGTGPQGAAGAQGADGLDGADSTVAGPQGATGAAGGTGPQGDDGAAGGTGAQGDTGAQGATGAPSTVAGPQGAAGADGSNGAQGATGAQGTAGAAGGTGAQGATGAQGVPGSAGPQGTPGVAGGTGAQGATGRAVVVTVNATAPSSPIAGDVWIVP